MGSDNEEDSSVGQRTPRKEDQKSVVVLDSPSPRSPPNKRVAVGNGECGTDDRRGLLGNSFVRSIAASAQAMYDRMSSACSENSVRSTIPMRMPPNQRECAFVVSLERENARLDCNIDGYGKWKRNRSVIELLEVEEGRIRLVSEKGRLKKGYEDFEYKIVKSDYCHADLGDDFEKKIYKLSLKGEEPVMALITYKWNSEPREFSPTPHGNAKKNLTPFLQ